MPEQVYNLLHNVPVKHFMIDFAQSNICRRALLLQYFAETFNQANCASCDNCLNPKEMFDATVLTQKILSCIYRTQQRFGINHIINILVGSKAKNILQYGHNKLSTYDIIHDYTPSQVKTVIYELLQQGYLKQSEDLYGILSLTQKSTAVLKGNEKVSLTKPLEITFTSKTKTSRSRSIDQTNINHDLFHRLRILRKHLADESHLPPYVIFSDKTLQELASYFPQTEQQFSQIYGIGQEKLKKYAQVFLKEIIAYCQPLNIKPILKNSNRVFSTHAPSPSMGEGRAIGRELSRTGEGEKGRIRNSSWSTDTVALTLELFHQGKSLPQIAKIRELTENTIHTHLQKAYLRGEKIDPDQFVSQDKQKAINNLFQQLGLDSLAPIKEALGDEYSYSEIGWVRTKLWITKK